MDATRFDELRHKLLNEKVFGPVWHYFLDHFDEASGFMDLGEPADDEFLQAVLAEVAVQLYRKSTIITGIRMVRLPEYGFIHGGFSIEGRIGGLFYFEEPDTGLIVVCEKPPSIEVKYVRFRTSPFRPRPQPSLN